MTVMIDKFFGLPQSFVRNEIVKGLSGSAIKVYVGLWHESERYMTRELIRTTRALIDLVGGSPNSHAKARAELARAGLLRAEQYGSDGFIFHLCDPETGQPWPFPPEERMIYQPKGASRAIPSQTPVKARKAPKSDIAGTSFLHGWNTVSSSPIKPQLQEPVTVPSWSEIGNQTRKPHAISEHPHAQELG